MTAHLRTTVTTLEGPQAQVLQTRFQNPGTQVMAIKKHGSPTPRTTRVRGGYDDPDEVNGSEIGGTSGGGSAPPPPPLIGKPGAPRPRPPTRPRQKSTNAQRSAMSVGDDMGGIDYSEIGGTGGGGTRPTPVFPRPGVPPPPGPQF